MPKRFLDQFIRFCSARGCDQQRDYATSVTIDPRLDLRGANWAVAQVPPQLRGLHKNSKKIITQGNIKILLETDNLE